MKWTWFVAGLAMLLIGSYLDSIRGPLLPVLTDIFTLNYQQSSGLLAVGYLSAFFLNLLLFPILGRLPLKRVSVFSLGLAAAVCGLAGYVADLRQLFFYMPLLAAIVAIFGTLSNLLVHRATSEHSRGRAMAALHTMFGLGSFLAPVATHVVLAESNDWSLLFISVVPLLVLLLLFAIFKLSETSEQISSPPVVLTTASNVGLDLHVVAVQIAYVLAEVLTSMWMTSYLVVEAGLPVTKASDYLAAFFIVMTCLRLLCSMFVKTNWIFPLLIASLIFAFVAFVFGRFGNHWALAAVGLLGPFFPLYMAQISLWFPQRHTRLTIWIVSGMQAMLGILNFAMGNIAAHLGLAVAYWLPAMMMVLALVLLLTVRTRVRESRA